MNPDQVVAVLALLADLKLSIDALARERDEAVAEVGRLSAQAPVDPS